MISTSLAIQWLNLCAPTAGGTDLIPGQGTNIPHAAVCYSKTNKQQQKQTNINDQLGRYIEMRIDTRILVPVPIPCSFRSARYT